MSSVYAAIHRNGKQVAIKVLHPALVGNRRARARFLREGYIANRIAHEGIVPIVDDGVTEDGLVYLVMDLLVGTTLEQYCRARGGRLPENETLAIAGAVLDVLGAAHAQGVVHRDIKASNVFLTTGGRVKLLDFGAARLRESCGAQMDTRSGTVLGTPGFMAPEQARGRWDEIDARTDLWAVGATMFRLLTGRLVHQAETPNEAIIAAAMTSAPSLAAVDPSLGNSADVIDKALKLDPRERWSSAGEMLTAVRSASSRLPSCELPRPLAEPEMMTTVDESRPSEATEVNVPRSPAATRPGWFRPGRRSLVIWGAIGAAAAVSLSTSMWRSGVSSAKQPANPVNETQAAPPRRVPLLSSPGSDVPAATPAALPATPTPRHRPRPRIAAAPMEAVTRPAATDTPGPVAVPDEPSMAPPAPKSLEDVLDERK
jgi:serine/threonine-protein kinase